jgi:hypothetical protein
MNMNMKMKMNMNMNKDYIRSLDALFRAYNRRPVDFEIAVSRFTVEDGSTTRMDTHRLFYFWFFETVWNRDGECETVEKAERFYKRHKTRVLSDIHDAWSLHLFVEFHRDGPSLKMRYKKSSEKEEEDNKLLVRLKDITNIKYVKGPLPTRADPFYGGDLVSCDIRYRGVTMKVRKNMHGDSCFKKAQVLFPMPDSARRSVALDFRRLSQLVGFERLTAPSKSQDAVFFNPREYIAIRSRRPPRTFTS